MTHHLTFYYYVFPVAAASARFATLDLASVKTKHVEAVRTWMG